MRHLQALLEAHGQEAGQETDGRLREAAFRPERLGWRLRVGQPAPLSAGFRRTRPIAVAARFAVVGLTLDAAKSSGVDAWSLAHVSSRSACASAVTKASYCCSSRHRGAPVGTEKISTTNRAANPDGGLAEHEQYLYRIELVTLIDTSAGM
jgi:hypothetical protein